jgi:hypothetical protein
MLNGFINSVCRLNVFRLDGIVRGFAERLFEDFRERAALHALGVEHLDRHLTGAARHETNLQACTNSSIYAISAAKAAW